MLWSGIPMSLYVAIHSHVTKRWMVFVVGMNIHNYGGKGYPPLNMQLHIGTTAV